MKTTRYTITLEKVIAMALALVLLASVFTGCNKTNEEENTTTTTTEVPTTVEVVTEVVTDENGETVTNDNGEAITTEVTKVVEVASQSEEKTISKKATATTTTTKQTETATKKNTSTGNSDKVTTTKPVTTTTKPTVTECNHTWTEWKNIRLWVQERTCSKCGWIEEREVDNRDNYMGTKAEYLELLGYVNQARREAGLNELVYITDWQSGANQRAQDITKVYSHKRPDGSHFLTAYNKNSSYNAQYGTVWCGGGENIVSGASTAKQAFSSWMNSNGHRETILNANSTGIVIARCDTYWVMNTFASVE